MLIAISISSCSTPNAPADMSGVPKTATNTFIDQMVAKYHGDASKLSPDERKEMDRITQGHTEIAMKGRPAVN
jgi:uncharacterized Zn-binding protein involved in type VI secretion